jgi:hypothetical protein
MFSMMKRYIVTCWMNINNSKRSWNCFEHCTIKENRLCCDCEYWSTNVLNSNWIFIFDEFCLFFDDNEILMFFYVNDIVFAFIASRKKDAENLIRRLKDIFDMRNLNSLNFFLDVRILQKLDTIWLIQNFYMNKLIKKLCHKYWIQSDDAFIISIVDVVHWRNESEKSSVLSSKSEIDLLFCYNNSIEYNQNCIWINTTFY